MAITHSATFDVTANGISRISGTLTANIGAGVYVFDQVFDGETNFFIPLGLESTLLASLVVKADRAVTVKTNSSSSPQETWNLEAGRPLIWFSGTGTAPIAGDLTGLFITNTSGGTATVEFMAGRSPALH